MDRPSQFKGIKYIFFLLSYQHLAKLKKTRQLNAILRLFSTLVINRSSIIKVKWLSDTTKLFSSKQSRINLSSGNYLNQSKRKKA